MELNEYQQAALKTAIYPNNYKVIYPALGITGEAGEVSDKVKKIIRDKAEYWDDGTLIVSWRDSQEIAKEIGDVLWYCATLAQDLGFSLEEVAQINIDKLVSRQDRGVIGGSGDNR